MSHLKDRYINPLTDFGFKRLFGTELNKGLLIDFLNQILPKKHQIKELNYAKNDHVGQNELDRKAIFDLYCVGESGERFIVELQKAKQNFFKDRSVYYSSFPIQEQALRGDWDYKLNPVYTVGILDFIFDDHKEEEELLHFIELKNQRGEVFYDKLKFIYIELPKFTKTEAELETHFDKWLYVFKHLAELHERPKALQERIFERLFKAAEIAKFATTERRAYEDSLKYYRDLKNVVDTAKEEGIEEGIERGIEEGIERGIEEGIERGIEEGIERGKQARNIEIAKTLKKNGVAADVIEKSTGLSPSEIKKL